MIRTLVDRLFLTLVLGLLIIAALHQAEPQPPSLLVRADYPVCVTIRNAPLEPHRHGTNLYPRRSDTA